MFVPRMSCGSAPLDSYTVSLLHMNGADNSTTFTDETGKIWTRYGSTRLESSISQFGGASAYFDGVGDYITTPDHGDFYMGSGNFTLDFWVKRYDPTRYDNVCGQGTGSSYTICSMRVDIGPTGAVTAIFANTSTQYTVQATGGITDTNWHHVAVVRNGTALKIYIDGVAKATTTISLAIINVSGVMNIGHSYDGDANYFKGYIDEFRISKGIARWTANFTPPIYEY